jgi:hypothetical protein
VSRRGNGRAPPTSARPLGKGPSPGSHLDANLARRLENIDGHTCARHDFEIRKWISLVSNFESNLLSIAKAIFMASFSYQRKPIAPLFDSDRLGSPRHLCLVVGNQGKTFLHLLV